jgi:hypothetical protein
MGKKATILVTVCVMIVVVVFFEFFVFTTPTQQSSDPYSQAYYDEFNKTPTPAYNYNFSPPISMYHALLIALESGGWNATSLRNMKISVELDYCAFLNSPNESGGGPLYPVTHSVTDWSPKQVNYTTYRYVWTIIVYYSGPFKSIPPPGYYYVDAATGEFFAPIL